MKLVMLFRIFLFSALLLSKHINADLAITDIKGLYTSIKPGYEYWSPIHGVIAVQTDFLRNLFLMEMQEEERQKKEAGKKEKSLILIMLRELFHINPINKALVVTQSERLIGRYLTPALLADLINHSMTTENMNKKQKEKEDAKFALFLREKGKIISKITTGKIKTFIQNVRDLIRNGMEEKYYGLPFIGHTILAAWLIKKIDTKADLVQFFDRLIELSSVLMIDNYNREQLLNDVYKPSDANILLKKFENIQVKNFDEFLRMHYEDIVFIGCSPLLQEGKISLHAFPQERSGFSVPFESKEKSFTDCTETSLRIFVDELLNNGTSFDYHPLKAKGIFLDYNIEKFYDRYNSFESANKPETHQAWLEAVSHIKSVPIEYVHVGKNVEETCEIESTVRNIVQGIRYIFSKTSNEKLGIQPIPDVITIDYMIDFFSHLLAAIFQGNSERKIILYSIEGIDDNGPRIILVRDGKPENNVKNDEDVESFAKVIITFFDVSSQQKFRLNISRRKHAELTVIRELVNINKIELYHIYGTLLLEHSKESYAALDLLSVIISFDSVAPLLKNLSIEYCDRMLIILTDVFPEQKKEIVNILKLLSSYEDTKDARFLLYFLPSLISYLEDQDRHTLDLVQSVIQSNFSNIFIAEYMQPFVDSLSVKKYTAAQSLPDSSLSLLFTTIIGEIMSVEKEALYDVVLRLSQSPYVIENEKFFTLCFTIVSVYNENYLEYMVKQIIPVLSNNKIITMKSKQYRLRFLQNLIGEDVKFLPEFEDLEKQYFESKEKI